MRSRAEVALLLLAGCSGGADTVVAVPPATAVTAPDAQPSGTTGPDAPATYDTVGYASWYGDGLEGATTASGAPFANGAISAAHRTLPLGSYAEVTALDTGRTILVRITDRGPHMPNRAIDLSTGAAKLLGTSATPLAAVRVRAATPTAADIAALSAGRPATARIDAPDAVLRALRRRLPAATVTVAPKTAPVRPAPVRASVAARPAAAGAGRYTVQVAAFSTAARAQALARSMKGHVVPGGERWRVRLGPFADRAAAQRARDAAAARGYGDASILTAD